MTERNRRDATEPVCTMVVITRDRVDELRQTLTALTALPDPVRIIVADNGSSDGTAAMVRREFGQVRLLEMGRNLGAVARNIAVEATDTDYVAFCDDDTRWQPGSPTAAASILDRYPRLAVAQGRCLVAPALTEDPLTPELRSSPVPRPDWLPYPALLGIMAGLSMVRVRAFRAVGGFAEKLWFGGEEELLALDLAAAGWWMCFVEHVVIHHQASTKRAPARRRQLGIRNTLWTAWARRPVRSAARHTVTVLRSAPPDRHTVVAVLRALAGIGWVLRHRAVVPPAVEEGLRLLEAPQRTSPARRYR